MVSPAFTPRRGLHAAAQVVRPVALAALLVLGGALWWAGAGWAHAEEGAKEASKTIAKGVVKEGKATGSEVLGSESAKDALRKEAAKESAKGGGKDGGKEAAKEGTKGTVEGRGEAKAEGNRSAKTAKGMQVSVEPTPEPAEPAPVAAKGEPVSMKDLQSRLSDKIEQVRAVHAPAKPKPRPAVRRVAAAQPGAEDLAAGAHGSYAANWAEPRRPLDDPHGGHAPVGPGMGTPAAPVVHAAHWSYTGDSGPEAWGSMKPEFATCSTGKRQSPIDIRDGVRVDMEPIRFEYQPSGFSVLDNGHTVQVNVERGNSISVMGRRFELVQFHFHRPSEERINGRGYDMVAHLVHKDLDGKLAVVAVLLEQGKTHPIVQQVWNNLPLEKNEELRAGSQMDLNALLPGNRAYYTYMGSLTTPPCSEGVLWMVMKQPVQLSAEQIGVFSKLYSMNARPIQSQSGRLIKESAAAMTTAAAP